MSAQYNALAPKKRIDITSLYTSFARRCPKNYYFDGEAHGFWEAVFVLEGNIGVTADDDVYSLRAGQMILHKPMEFHRLWAGADTEPLVCVFSFSADVMPSLDGRVFAISAEDAVRVRKLLDSFSLHYVLKSTDDDAVQLQICDVREGCDDIAYADVCYLEFMLLKIISRGADTAVSDSSPAARKYAEIVGVMEKNIDKRLGVEEIAAMCNMSVSNVKKIFSRYSGKGAANYFNEMKIRHSLEMLDRGISVSDISSSLGFEDQNYFSTVFRRIMGKSPIKYKKEILRGE